MDTTSQQAMGIFTPFEGSIIKRVKYYNTNRAESAIQTRYEGRIMQEGVFITPQGAMEPVLNETLIDHESRPSLKAVESSLAFHNR